MNQKLSPWFTLGEFSCRHCGIAKAHPSLVSGLGRLRALAYPTGLIIRSGYRCPEHNRAVGGAAISQHLYGTAADVDLRAELSAVVGLGVFSGIGWQKIGGKSLVRHVDVRHVGKNPTGGTCGHPTIWRY